MEPRNQKEKINFIAWRQQQQQHDDLLVETWKPKDIMTKGRVGVNPMLKKYQRW